MILIPLYLTSEGIIISGHGGIITSQGITIILTSYMELIWPINNQHYKSSEINDH